MEVGDTSGVLTFYGATSRSDFRNWQSVLGFGVSKLGPSTVVKYYQKPKTLTFYGEVSEA